VKPEQIPITNTILEKRPIADYPIDHSNQDLIWIVSPKNPAETMYPYQKR
jgi:hypothetical protein